jgi:parallel beta-helix repeat protein
VKACAFLAVIFLVLVRTGLASPQVLSYQGSVLRPDRLPVVDGAYDMRFSIHTHPTTGVLEWTETDAAVAVRRGLFSAILGDGTPLPLAVFRDVPDLWLEVEIDLSRNHSFEAGEMYAPRQRLTAAVWAIEADRLQGRQPADFAAAAHQHAAADITSGRLAEPRIDDAIARDSELPPRPYDAILATSGGDFTSLSAALAAGRRTIFIRNGTYFLDAQLEITTGGFTIVGESRDGVIIDCNGWPYIRIRGSGSNYTAGTISVNSGSTAVTGVGTGWLAGIAVGEYIRIGDSWYRVAAVVANDVLTLESAYKGPNLAGATYSVAGYLTNIHIENVTVRNHTGLLATLEMAWVLDCSVRNCRIQDSTELCLFFQNAHRVIAKGNIFQSAWMGIRADQCSNCEFAENLCTNNSYGIFLENSAPRMIIRDNHCTNHSFAGISINHADDCVVSGNTSSYNSTGISISTSCTAVTVTGNACAHNGSTGISVSNSESAAVAGNTCRLNGGIGISIWQSRRCAVSGNISIANGGNGIEVRSGDESTVVGNTSTGNGGYGIEVRFATASNNILGFNTLTGNTSGAGLDGGTTTRQKGTNYPAF